jgi:hypothetical protein
MRLRLRVNRITGSGGREQRMQAIYSNFTTAPARTKRTPGSGTRIQQNCPKWQSLVGRNPHTAAAAAAGVYGCNVPCFARLGMRGTCAGAAGGGGGEDGTAEPDRAAEAAVADGGLGLRGTAVGGAAGAAAVFVAVAAAAAAAGDAARGADGGGGAGAAGAEEA